MATTQRNHHRISCSLFVPALFALWIGSARAEVFEFAIVGDAGTWNSSAEMVVKSIQAAKIKNLILPGDNLYNPKGTYKDVWGHWVGAGLHLDVVAIGNHTRTYAEEIEYFKMPAEYYSAVRGPIRFLVLNSDNESNADLQAAWLELELSKLKEKFVFIVLHHPSYTITQLHPSREREKFQSKIRPLLWKYRSKITALLLGHDHIAAFYTADDLPMVVSGAVQNQRSESISEREEEGRKIKRHWVYRSTPYWAALRVDAEKGRVSVNFVDAELGPSCEVRLVPKPIKLGPECGLSDRKKMPHPVKHGT